MGRNPEEFVKCTGIRASKRSFGPPLASRAWGSSRWASHTIVRRDEDGDGYVLEGSDLCGDPDRPDYSLSTRIDCDDTNPETTYWQWTDADGDGFGTGTPSCVPPDPSLAALGGDCDDDDQARHPKAVEPWGDGIDSDCDGSDDGACNIDEELPAAGNAAACDGPDLFCVIRGDCSGCSSRSRGTVNIGNRGGSRAQGNIEFVTRESVIIATLHLDLEPGAFTPPITIHERTLELVFNGDCDPDNDMLGLSACILP